MPAPQFSESPASPWLHQGSENCILDGDSQSEHLLSEIVGVAPYKGVRHANMESLYEYGSRAGFWRLHRLFTERNMPCTVYACALAIERNPEAALAMVDAGWEVATHGYRWWDYQNVDEATEREHIKKVSARRMTPGPHPGRLVLNCMRECDGDPAGRCHVGEHARG